MGCHIQTVGGFGNALQIFRLLKRQTTLSTEKCQMGSLREIISSIKHLSTQLEWGSQARPARALAKTRKFNTSQSHRKEKKYCNGVPRQVGAEADGKRGPLTHGKHPPGAPDSSTRRRLKFTMSHQRSSTRTLH